MLTTCPQCKRAVPGTPLKCPFCKASIAALAAAPAVPGAPDRLPAGTPALVQDLVSAAYNLAANRRHEEALQIFLQAAGIAPDVPKIRHLIGMALSALGRTADALAAHELAATLDPTVAQYWYDAAVCRANLNQLAEALDAYDKALERNPRYLEALNNKGNLLRRLKRPGEALQCFQQAVVIAPQSPNAWFNLALTAEGLAETRAAVDAYRRFLTLATPEQAREAEAARQRLAVLEGGAPAVPRPAPQRAPATSKAPAGPLTTMSDAVQAAAPGAAPATAPAPEAPLPKPPPVPRAAVRQVAHPVSGGAPARARAAETPGYLRVAAAPYALVAKLAAGAVRPRMGAKGFLLWAVYAWWGAIGTAGLFVSIDGLQGASIVVYPFYLGAYFYLRAAAAANRHGALSLGEILVYGLPGMMALAGFFHALSAVPAVVLFLAVAASAAAVVMKGQST